MKIYRNEGGYINLIRDVLTHGTPVPDRTGVGSIALFDAKLVFDTDQTFPFSTIRPAPLRMAFEEFWFFLRGETNTKLLEEKGVNFWRGNTSREFLDSRGMKNFPEGDMGTAYGHQFRNFGGVHGQYGTGKDQLLKLYEGLVNDPYGRRHYVTFWNPSQSHTMSLTPCWHSHEFVVLPNRNGRDTLNLKLLNRSLDVAYGCSFAVQQYALYQKCMAQLLGMKVGKLSCDLSQIHIYNNQIEFAEEICTREFGMTGTVEINKPLESIQDLIAMQWEDVIVGGLIVNKAPFVAKRPSMAV